MNSGPRLNTGQVKATEIFSLRKAVLQYSLKQPHMLKHESIDSEK